ncbi:flagellar type III secretion system pore protein FliP [Isosphaeraceae bacterium EP7]
MSMNLLKNPSRSLVLALSVATLFAILGAGPEEQPPQVRLNRAPQSVKAKPVVTVPPAVTGVSSVQPAISPADPSIQQAQAPAASASTGSPAMQPTDWFKNLQGVPLFAAVSLAPAAVLMVTAFVRINIVLVLLRQALGSPQVPGNQVLSALALLLTALVMRPVATDVYDHAITPFAEHRLDATQAWEAGSAPIKAFMLRQIVRTGHQGYLEELHDLTAPPGPGRVEPDYVDEFPLIVVAPAYLLSELTTALWIGFAIYLPFLVVDLVVSAVLAAMGLFMLPPSLVSMPLKLILFVLADGWMLVAGMLLRGFS